MNVSRFRNVAELVTHARQFGAAHAFSRSGVGRGLSFQDLDDCVEHGSRRLRVRHASPGTPILLLLESSPHWPAAFFSILRAGHVAVPLPIDAAAESVAAIAASAGARALVYSDATRRFASALPEIDLLAVSELFAGSRPACSLPSVDNENLAVLAFTSGSTGQPRAVELTHRNLLANVEALLSVRRATPGDVALSMLPPAHLFELVVGLLAPVACGAHVVYADSLLPNRLLASMRDEGVTDALAVPALVGCLYQEVVDSLVTAGLVAAESSAQSPQQIGGQLRPRLHPVDSARLVSAVRSRIGRTFKNLIVGGAAVDWALAEIVAAIGVRVEVGYGLTEAGPVVSVGAVGDCPAGSVGRPLPGVQVSIAPDDEILVRGPSVMRGYWRDPVRTAQVLADGWLHTGDRGRLDTQGNLFVIGRLKEAIVTASGRTMCPEEIEPYYGSPLFGEYCAAGLPGDCGNDVPTLIVTAAAPGISHAQLQEAFVRLRSAAPANCRLERMVSVKGPLPRTASGKIGRRKIIETCQSAARSDDPTNDTARCFSRS